MAERLLAIDEVAQMLAVTKSMIYAWVHQNKIPYVKLGKRLLRFREEDIIAWVSEMEVQPEPYAAPRMRARRPLAGRAARDSYIDGIIKNAKRNIRWN
jgi:excisionase family DNA binding protein